jgi:type VI secretion system secreted protein Hcp
MAEPVHLTFKVSGNQIKGESSQTSLDRKDTIECFRFEHAVDTTREAGSGMATGRRQYAPIKIMKAIDASSPLLFKQMVTNATGDAAFKFYRPNPAGDGTTEQFYTIELKGARVSGINQIVFHTQKEENAHTGPMEEVQFVFQSITWTYTKGGVTHEDTWGTQK